MKLPHMPLWVFDVESDEDCRRMSDAEFGRYMRLLIRQWIEGSVPADASFATRIAMLDLDSTDSVQSILDRKFNLVVDGRRKNQRCEEERQAALTKVERNRRNGSGGGRPQGEPRLIEEPPKPPRKPDPIFDCVVELFYAGNLIESQRGLANRATADFKALGATPDEIRDRLKRYRSKWPTMTPTAMALVKNWAQFAAGGLPAPGASKTARLAKLRSDLANAEKCYLTSTVSRIKDEIAQLEGAA